MTINLNYSGLLSGYPFSKAFGAFTSSTYVPSATTLMMFSMLSAPMVRCSSLASFPRFFSWMKPAAEQIASYASQQSSRRASSSSSSQGLWSTIKETASDMVGAITDFGKRMVSNARKYLGYKESDGSYKKFTQGRTEAWCADFVSYIARESGLSGFNFPAVSGILNWGKKNGKFHKSPKVGDAIIFKGCGASHTGIVAAVSGGKVYTIEGNTSDKVAERSYSLSDPKITGYVTLA